MISRRLTRLFSARLIPPIVCLLAFAVSDAIHAGGALSRIRSNVRSGSSSPARDDDYEDHDHDEEHDHRPRRIRHRRSHDDGACHAAPILCFTPHACSPSPPIVEYHVIEHHLVTPASPFATTTRLPNAPLPDPTLESVPPPVADAAGTLGTSTPTSTPQTVFHQPWEDDWSVRLSAFYGHDLQDLSQANVSALWQSPGWLGVEASVTTFRESWDAQRDHLWIGDVNLVFETFHVGATRIRLGFGVNWLADTIGAEAGLNLTAGFDMPLAPRWTLAGEADIGNLGAADFWHGQLSLGRQFSQAEWILGFDHYNIGGEQLHGAFTGLRFRF